MNHVEFPEMLFHGTTLDKLDNFKKYLINPRYWKHNRDFGFGLYTTNDLNQAIKCSKLMARATGG